MNARTQEGTGHSEGPGFWKTLGECLLGFKVRHCEVVMRGGSLDVRSLEVKRLGSPPSLLCMAQSNLAEALGPLVPSSHRNRPSSPTPAPITQGTTLRKVMGWRWALSDIEATGRNDFSPLLPILYPLLFLKNIHFINSLSLWRDPRTLVLERCLDTQD